MLDLLSASLLFLPQSPASPAPLRVELTPRAPETGAGLRWSPKGAKVALTRRDAELTGSFALGPRAAAPVALKLGKSPGAAHYDLLWLDEDRDGRWSDGEQRAIQPSEQRGKFWSSFEGSVLVPPTEGTGASRPYPLSLWFVEDPAEPAAEPVLRWSRRGWHEGQLEIGGKQAFVLVTEMEMDGVFDQRDAWALARDRKNLLAADSRGLEGHCWLDGVAYRPVKIDPDGGSLSLEAFAPGFTEEEERARNDVLAPDRAAPRADKALSFGHDLASALAAAQRDHKRVLVDFQTSWCGPCRQMELLVYTSRPVVEAAKDLIAVQLDGDEQRELVKRHNVTGYPTMLLFDSSGQELRRAVGYRSVKEMVEFLRP